MEEIHKHMVQWRSTSQQAILNNIFPPSQWQLVAYNPTPIQGDHGDNSQSRDPPIVFLCEHDVLLQTHVQNYNASSKKPMTLNHTSDHVPHTSNLRPCCRISSFINTCISNQHRLGMT